MDTPDGTSDDEVETIDLDHLPAVLEAINQALNDYFTDPKVVEGLFSRFYN